MSSKPRVDRRGFAWPTTDLPTFCATNRCMSFSSATVLAEVSMLSFFFSSRRRHTRFDCDWSSDVCSSDLLLHDTAVNLGYVIEVVEHLNGDEADDPILYAVSYLLRAAKRFADEGVSVALA